MNFLPVEMSAVVTANDYNPTILNPDFLRINEIVRSEWKWKLNGAPITTPAYATVQYNTGVSISVDPNKFQVTDQKFSGNLAQNRVSEIAKNHVEVLPHVRYKAVGINFMVFAEKEKACSFLTERFLKEPILSDKVKDLKGFSVSFSYELDNGKIVLKIDEGEFVEFSNGHPKVKKGVIVSSNFHQESITSYPNTKEIITNIEKVSDHWDSLNTKLSTLFD